MREFPFDSQILEIVAVVTGSTTEELVLKSDESLAGMLGEVTVSDWQVELAGIESDTFQPPGIADNLSRLRLRLRLTRIWRFYLWTLLVPLSLIVLMAGTVFFMDPTLVNPQFSISTAAVFTMIAFRFSMRFLLPEVTYMTRLDRFVLVATVLVFVGLVRTIVTSRLNQIGRSEAAERIDRWGRWVYLGDLPGVRDPRAGRMTQKAGSRVAARGHSTRSSTQREERQMLSSSVRSGSQFPS